MVGVIIVGMCGIAALFAVNKHRMPMFIATKWRDLPHLGLPQVLDGRWSRYSAWPTLIWIVALLVLLYMEGVIL